MQSFRCTACHHTAFDKFFKHIGSNEKEYTIVRCALCGSGSTFPTPSEKEIFDFYTKDYQGLVKSNIIESKDPILFAQSSRAVIEDSLQRIKWGWRKTGQKISDLHNLKYLDVGCGYGFSVEAGNQLGLISEGIDYDSDAIGLGKFHLGLNLNSLSIEVFSKSVSTPPQPLFDLISEWQVLEHVADVDEHVRALRSCLNDGGIILFTVPNYGGIYAKIKKESWYLITPPEHLNYFTQQGLRSLLKRHNFQPLFVGTQFRTSAPLIQLGIRNKLGKLMKETKSDFHLTFLKICFRLVSVIKRYVFYFPLNFLIYYARLGGNSTFIVARKI